jgi:hypothetical protein
MLRSEVTFNCMDCYKDTCNYIYDYSVRDEVWLKVVPGWVGHLCPRCLRVRLQRPLTMDDFELDKEVNEHITKEFLEIINGTQQLPRLPRFSRIFETPC